jgi:glycosyltransferase involved in cell wall biosynthesis
LNYMIKHSIVMICYNQQDYIRKALDSVLKEKTKPYEIIVGDDCSLDNTRNILMEYKREYPDIVNLVFHEKNLGIFGNLNAICRYASGDMVHLLAGDDWFEPGFLESTNKKITELNLQPSSLAFILLPKVVLHYPDGSEERVINSQRDLKRFSQVGVVLRDILKWRMVGMSKALYSKWPLFEEDASEIGPWADRVHHVLLAQYIDAQYLMNCDGAVYRLGVGVASKAGARRLQESYLKALMRIKECYEGKRLKLLSKDARYLDFLIASYSAKVKPSCPIILKYFAMAARVCFLSINDSKMVLADIYASVRCRVNCKSTC